jgi:transcriptional regulator with XRE-family HTH domain
VNAVTDTFANFGLLLAAMRKRRQLRMADIAGNTSLSTISRFERGSQTISIKLASDLFRRVHASLPETAELVDGSTEIPEMWQTLAEAALTEDTRELDKVIVAFEEKPDTINAMIVTVLKTYRSMFKHEKLDRGHAIAPVIHYLLGNGRWFLLEFQLFAASIYLANPEDSRHCLIRAIHEIDHAHAHIFLEPFTSGLFYAAVAAIEKHDVPTANVLLGNLRGLVATADTIFLKYRIRMIEAALRCSLRNEPHEYQHIVEMLTFLHTIGADNYCVADRHWLRKMGIEVHLSFD